MQIFISCPPGVADLTAAELRNCGAAQVSEFKLGVQAEGSLEVAYRACLWSRTASRVLLPLGTFPAATQEQLYEGISSIDWQQHISPTCTIVSDCGGASCGITYTHFGAIRTMEAICQHVCAGL